MSTHETMKAVRIHSYGSSDVLVYEDAPRPQPAAQQVLIRIQAAGVNPVDWVVREGWLAERLPMEFPLILGWDVSGTVVETGPEVTKFRPGDEVYGMIGFPRVGSAYAEYVAADQSHLALKPRAIDHLHAAAVPLAALTAWQALFDAANLQAGQTVLIHAAAGGVGHLAVQLAKWKGASVIGTASAKNAGFLKELGVDQVIDYTRTPFETLAGQVDVVLESIGGESLERSYSVVRPGGILVSIVGELSAEQLQSAGIRGARISVVPSAAQLAELSQLIDAGVIHPLVDTIFPLAEARQAQELSAQKGTRGKIVLEVG